MNFLTYFTSGKQPDIFKGRGGFVEFGHFDKHFLKNTRKIGPQGGKKFEVFLLDILTLRTLISVGFLEVRFEVVGRTVGGWGGGGVGGLEGIIMLKKLL